MPEEYSPTVEAHPQPTAEELRALKPTREKIEGKPGTEAEIDLDEKPLVLMGTPYVVDEMGLADLYEDDIDGLKEKARVVDTWIKSQLLKTDAQPLVKNYKKVLEQTKIDLGIGEENPPFTQMTLLYYYLKGKLNI